MGQIKFIGEDDGGNQVSYARINTEIESPANGNEIGRFNIITLDNLAGSAGEHERLTISGTESVFNEDSADIDFRVESNGNPNMLFVNAGEDGVVIGDTDTNGQIFRVKGVGDVAEFVSTNEGSGGTQIILKHESASPANADLVGIINYWFRCRKQQHSVCTNSWYSYRHLQMSVEILVLELVAVQVVLLLKWT